MTKASFVLPQRDPDTIDSVASGYLGMFAGDDGKWYAKSGSSAPTEIGATKTDEVQELIDDSVFLVKSGISNYRLGNQYSEIDSTLIGTWVFDGTDAFANKLGVNNTKPTVEPLTGARSNDTGYVAGDADTAAILAGYNNVNNALAGLIASNHSMLYAGADHCSIWGGSLGTIHSGSRYSIIAGGSSNTIEANCQYAGVYNSDQIQLKTSGDINTRGHRSTVIGSSQCTVRARNTVLIGCSTVTVDGAYNTIISSDTTTVTSGIRSLIVATNSTIGATAAASYSLICGLQHTVDAGRALVVGEYHVVGAHAAVVVTGSRCVTSHPACRVHSGRHRGNVAGRNQLLEWVCSQETTNTTATRLSLEGSLSFPVQPADSVVTGAIHVTGVSDAGTVSAYRIDLVSKRSGTGTPTLHANSTTTIFNGLSLPTPPTVNATSDGIYRVQVVGLDATNIRWTATFHGNQTVYTT